MPEHDQGRRYHQFERMLQWPMMALTFVFLIAVILPLDHGLPASIERVAKAVEDTIWGLFAVEYLVLLGLAADRRHYVRTHILDAIVVVVPGLRVLRLGRLLRLVRLLNLLRLPSMVLMGLRALEIANQSFRRYRIGYILAAMAVVLLLASGAMLYLEHAVNPALSTYPSCLWWGVVTMTTVGYGDAAPVTAGGRALAMLFMLIGIGLAGVVTATIASIFVGIERQDDDQRVLGRFEALERQLVQLSAQVADLTELQRAALAATETGSEQEAS